MTAASVTLAGRVAAAARMLDACTITSPGGVSFDANLGAPVTTAGTQRYTGPCEVQVREGLNSQAPEVGERLLTVQGVTVKVPVSVRGVAVDDIVTVTASVLDPSLVGRRYRVVEDHAKSFATARRFHCVEVTG